MTTRSWPRSLILLSAILLAIQLSGYVYARYIFKPRHSLKSLVKTYGTVFLTSPLMASNKSDLTLIIIDTKEISELSSPENVLGITLGTDQNAVEATEISLKSTKPLRGEDQFEANHDTLKLPEYWLRILNLRLNRIQEPLVATTLQIHYRDGLTEVYDLGEISIVPEWPKEYLPMGRIPYHCLYAKGRLEAIAVELQLGRSSRQLPPGTYSIKTVDLGVGNRIPVDINNIYVMSVPREAADSLEEIVSESWEEWRRAPRSALREPSMFSIPAGFQGFIVVVIPVDLPDLTAFVLCPSVTLVGADSREVTFCQPGNGSWLEYLPLLTYEDCTKALELGSTYTLLEH
ncbi:MAG: hypothetical protein IMW97_00680 [Firmicutes bacterium]|nr:hypothetical protein [Candidatus Fermentithermobacillaceae bacterium]